MEFRLLRLANYGEHTTVDPLPVATSSLHGRGMAEYGSDLAIDGIKSHDLI